MFEYTESYLKPFSWARKAYEYTLGLSSPSNINVSQDSLTKPSLPDVSDSTITVKTDSDWNKASLGQIALVGAIYQSADQAEQYFNSLYSLISSRVAESEKRVQELDSNLRVLLSSSKQVATTSISIKGGDTTLLETDNKFYRIFGPLEPIPSEGIFRLKDTGTFSSIRSLGGFAGKAEIEYSLGEIVENGNLNFVTDGTRNTFWMGTFYSPAPVRADQNDVPWLPDEYKHGFAFMLTYYLDRPTLATEVFVDPVTTEPMDLVSISWTPTTLGTTLINGSFSNAASGWSFYGTAAAASSLGIDNGACVSVTNSSGWVSQTFALPSNLLTVGSTSLVGTGSRAQINYSMKGRGDLYAGVRIIWLDASGSVLSYKLKEDYPTGFFSGQKLIDSIPNGSVSGRIDFGLFTPAGSPASAYFDDVALFLGERQFQCDEIIDKPKTISLPEIVRSGRFSFVFAQRNPRREVMAKESASSNFNPIQGLNDLDVSLQKATVDITQSLVNKGPGTTLFAYRIGMKELDLRYREHIPRGSIVSLPLFSRKEIREIWVTSELGQFYNDNTKFYIYPFADDPEQRSEIAPFRMGDVDNAQTTTITPGEVLRIYTFEEQASGWYNSSDRSYVISPRNFTERFDGTDRDGKIRLTNIPHLRRPYMASLTKWLDRYAIWPTQFDPNLQTIYGLPASQDALRNQIRENSSAVLDMNDLISRQGYTPIKVTIQTDKWTAQPDIYGKPETSKIRTARGELLTASTVVQTVVEQQQSVIGFEAWLNSTTVAQFNSLNYQTNTFFGGTGIDGGVTATMFLTQNQSKSLRQIIDDVASNNRQTVKSQFQAAYDRLKNQGKINNDTSQTNTLTAAVQAGDVFATRFKPIVTGPRGTFIKLFYRNPDTDSFLPVPNSSYEIMNAGAGLIRVLSAGPSGFTDLLADYHYITDAVTEDFFSTVIDSVTVGVSSINDVTSQFAFQTRSLPITRNLTDYITGKIPVLRPPNFERLNTDYWPVIEYYVNSEGEIIFARDFFRYGDMPAIITVESLTLGINPRVGIEVTRSGSPSVTPTIYNLSLRVREGSSSPMREA